jgi:hypothetical protein
MILLGIALFALPLAACGRHVSALSKFLQLILRPPERVIYWLGGSAREEQTWLRYAASVLR